ncbi:N-acetyltransferase [Filobacillus milosensis]|uniref:N-acetyltransferase n=1 Tax=Filobacillus milosensis TaxID=94137 RepID=A0A4Y8IN59_9BACI|nr:GNAT family N-acetyltransferase [Filobacillus milosensis]TFB22857.1 N-acetyltransferase [Filobacillus milosensis]
MDIKLKKATNKDANIIFDIQIKAFKPLLKKYKDCSTNPANEDINRVYDRINNPSGGFYKIILESKIVGAICVQSTGDFQYWISPMFILPEFQGKGLAQVSIKLLEDMVQEANSWHLATLLEEKGNCYLYEKLGFRKTSVIKRINDRSTLVYYRKVLKP